MILPSGMVSAALNRNIISKANHFGRATQGLGLMVLVPHAWRPVYPF